MPLYSLDVAVETQSDFDRITKYISKHARIKKVIPQGPGGGWPEIFFHTSAANAQKILNHLYGSYQNHGLTIDDIQIRSK